MRSNNFVRIYCDFKKLCGVCAIQLYPGLKNMHLNKENDMNNGTNSPMELTGHAALPKLSFQ